MQACKVALRVHLHKIEHSRRGVLMRGMPPGEHTDETSELNLMHRVPPLAPVTTHVSNPVGLPIQLLITVRSLGQEPTSQP